MEIIPLAGRKDALYNPYILTGDEAQKLLNHISKMSRKFGTKIIIKDNVGVIELEKYYLTENIGAVMPDESKYKVTVSSLDTTTKTYL